LLGEACLSAGFRLGCPLFLGYSFLGVFPGKRRRGPSVGTDLGEERDFLGMSFLGCMPAVWDNPTDCIVGVGTVRIILECIRS